MEYLNIPNLLCFSVYFLAVLIGILQVVKLIKYQLEKMRGRP